MMTVFQATFPVLLLPISSELSASPEQMRTIGMLLVIFMALGAPVTGFLLDRFAIWKVLAGCSAITAIGYIALGWSHSVFMFGTLTLLSIGLPSQGLGYGSTAKLVTGHFSRRAGIAVAITLLGATLAGVIMPPLSAWLAAEVGWRSTYQIFGLAVAMLLVGTIVLSRGALAQSSVAQSQEKVVGSAWILFRQLPFWMMILTVGLGSGLLIAIQLTVVAHAMGKGWTLVEASVLLSVSAGAASVSKPTWGFAIDRFGPVFPFAIGYVIAAVALVLLAQAQSLLALSVGLGLVGFGMGVLLPANPVLLTRLFGWNQLGRAYGLTALCMIPLIGAPTILTGQLNPREGDYTASYLVYAALLVLLACVAAALPRRDVNTAPIAAV
jgi:MFS family permease